MASVGLTWFSNDVTKDWHCVICLENTPKNLIYHKDGKVPHVFHRECLAKWLKEKPICPICLKPLKKNIPQTFLEKVSLKFKNIIYTIETVIKEKIFKKFIVPICKYIRKKITKHQSFIIGESGSLISRTVALANFSTSVLAIKAFSHIGSFTLVMFGLFQGMRDFNVINYNSKYAKLRRNVCIAALELACGTILTLLSMKVTFFATATFKIIAFIMCEISSANLIFTLSRCLAMPEYKFLKILLLPATIITSILANRLVKFPISP